MISSSRYTYLCIYHYDFDVDGIQATQARFTLLPATSAAWTGSEWIFKRLEWRWPVSGCCSTSFIINSSLYWSHIYLEGKRRRADGLSCFLSDGAPVPSQDGGGACSMWASETGLLGGKPRELTQGNDTGSTRGSWLKYSTVIPFKLYYVDQSQSLGYMNQATISD